MPPSRSPTRSSPLVTPRSSLSPTLSEDNPDANILAVADNLEGRPTGFRFNGLRFLLTYTECEDLALAELEFAVQQWANLTSWKIGRENNAHGGSALRYYLLVVFHVRLRGRQRDIFDVAGVHPNIKSIRPGTRSLKRVYDHVTKGGDIHGPMVPPETTGAGDEKLAFWAQAIGAVTMEEAREIIINGSPKDYIKCYINIEAFLRGHFANDPRSKPLQMRSRFQFLDINLPQALVDWRNNEFTKIDRPKSLILVGPSRLGKSQWARSLDEGVAYMETGFDLSLLHADTSYLVVSDIPNHKIGGQWVITALKAFFASQDVATISGKYLPLMTFSWGKPFIYLCNDFPDKWRVDPWLSENSVIVDLQENQRLY
ncbi:hypothetical protein BJ165DRAFT_1452723 [Panaeolus papilionaceus]|nr:hypothetical protein BJ165DRAFT_1452723 [Panaeolus papilionaceus]